METQQDNRRRVRLRDGRSGIVVRRAINAEIVLIEWDDNTNQSHAAYNNYQRFTWVDTALIVSDYVEVEA